VVLCKKPGAQKLLLEGTERGPHGQGLQAVGLIPEGEEGSGLLPWASPPTILIPRPHPPTLHFHPP
jgi:hypothetical protein